VLKRAGHTESAADLARLAGLESVGLLAEVVNDDGTMARRDQLMRFARQHGLRMISIADLIRYRHAREKLVRQIASTRMPLAAGTFVGHVYESVLDGEQHMALVKGDPSAHESVLVRVHSECLTGDMLGSLRCDCGEQLRLALEMIEAQGVGVLVYLRGHEGRGIGLGHKIRAYSLQDGGADTVEANLSLRLPIDGREYGIGAQILADLGVSRMRLMTNNPHKYDSLGGFGLKIVERVPIVVASNPENVRYLATKREKLGHLFECG
jgi:3,4-dihydroxy 2-butanone 4-phosphate synthase/GTP cyclohydrolase II